MLILVKLPDKSANYSCEMLTKTKTHTKIVKQSRFFIMRKIILFKSKQARYQLCAPYHRASVSHSADLEMAAAGKCEHELLRLEICLTKTN